MSDDAQAFFDAIVDPAVVEFEAAEGELVQASIEADAARLERVRGTVLRRARTAAIELHQFADRVVEARPAWAPTVSIDGLRNWLMANHCVRRPDDVQVLHDVADAFKHAKLSRGRKDRPWFVRSDRAIITTTTGWGDLGWGEARWGGPEQTIVEQDDGRKRALEFVLGTVRDAWWSAMGR